MQKVTTILLALALAITVATTTATAGGHQYGWTLSNSSLDPFSNTGAPLGVPGTLYVWFQCSTLDGASAAEFDISSSAATVLSSTAQNGWLNAGGASDLLLAVGGCPPGPVVAITTLVLDAAGSQYCLVPSAAKGSNVTVDCSPLPSGHLNNVIGFSSTGGPVDPGCTFEGFCPSVAVDDDTWGGIKAMYR